MEHKDNTTKKSTLEVDENDILKMSEKIKQNAHEDAEFAANLEDFLNDERKKTTEPLHIGKTSNALAISGANQNLDIVIAPRTIVKCTSEPDKHYHGHGLDKEIIQQIPKELRNPIMIFSGSRENTLVAITQIYDKQNRQIMIAVGLSESNKRHEVNRVSSIYGRNSMNNYLKSQIEKGNLISCNIEKADRMLQSAGLQLPPEETFISFDNSIAYSMQNVKEKRREVSMMNKKDVINKIYAEFNEFERQFLNQINEYSVEKNSDGKSIAEDIISASNEYSDKKNIVECIKISESIKLPETAEDADKFDFSQVVTFPEDNLISALEPSVMSLDNIYSHLSEGDGVTAQNISVAMTDIVKEEISQETLELLNSTFYFPEAEQISNHISVEKLESLPSDAKKNLKEEISALWSKLWHELPDLTEDPNNLWALEQLPGEFHTALKEIYEQANKGIINELPNKEEKLLSGSAEPAKRKPEGKEEQKHFTFSRKQLNENAHKVKEEHTEQTHRDKESPNHNNSL